VTAPTPPADPAGQPDPAKTPAGDPPKTDPPKDPAAGDPPKDPKDEPLGEGGLKALKAEREAREALEKQIKALAPLQKIAEALGQGDPAKGQTEIEQITERLSKHEEELGNERTARWRAEIANDKGLTTEQAARLAGKTKDELAADADALKALFPSTPTTPKPDPSQGGRGGSGVDLDARIQEAQKKGDFRAVISLQNQKLADQTK
jgi:hypothetical protein